MDNVGFIEDENLPIVGQTKIDHNVYSIPIKRSPGIIIDIPQVCHTKRTGTIPIYGW